MSSIFPFIQPQVYVDTEDTELPLYYDVEWDFSLNKPVFQRGEPKITTGLPAVMSWAWRALNVERFLNEIYSWNYGNEVKHMVGEAWDPDVKISEAARYVRECLTVLPYIKNATNISAAFLDGTVSLSCTVETVYGDSNMEVNMGV